MKSTIKYLLFIVIIFTFTSNAFSQVPNYVPTNGLVGYWPFNGNANDESGNGNNGTVMNGVLLTSDRFNNLNSAYSFDGIDDRIFINNSIFDNGSNFTFSGWYFLNTNINPNNGNNSHIILNTSPHNGLGLAMNWGSSNKYSLSLGSGTPSISWNILFDAQSGQNIEVQSWKFITLVKLSNTYSLYVDGVLDQIWTANNSIQTYLYKLYFGGCDPLNSNEVINGKLDDIGIWNRALTPQEITNLYTSTVPVSCLPSYVPTSGLVGYWPFCGNANDESGNGNNGTVNGATLTTDRFGSANSAYYFDYYQDIVTPFNLISGTQSRTISFWMKNSNGQKTITPIWYGGNSSQPQMGAAFNLLFNRNETLDQCGCWPEIQQGIGVSADWIYFLRQYNTGDNQWHFYSFVLANSGDSFSQVQIFVDGVLLASNEIFNYNGNASTTVNTVNNNPLVFGRSMANLGYPSDTQMRAPTEYLDDISIYNRALTPTEITQLYTDASVTPPVACTSFLGEDQTVCAGTSVTLSASGSSSACPTLPTNLQTGLVGYWPFCGNANDASGNGNNGTVNGATLTTDRFGNANSAFSLSGTSNSILVNDSPSLDFPQGVFSLCAEVKLSGLGVEQGLIDHLDVGGPSVLSRYTLRVLPNNKIRFNLKDDENDWSSVDSDISLDVNVWYSIVGVFNYATQELHIYINGEIHDGTIIYNALTGPAITPPNSLFLGNFAGAYNLNGTIDNVSIYNRALSPSEIQQLFTLGHSTYLWSNGETTPTINVSPTTTTTYTCTVTDANGNVCTDSVTVFVPQIEATDLSICAGESTSLSISGINSTSTTSACPTLPTNLQTGLVGYWPFCGNANDASGNGNNGTVNGATLTTDRFGSANSAYSFDGDDRIDIGNLNLGQMQYSYTYSTWFRTSSTTNTDKTIISDYNSSSGDDDIFSCWHLLEFNNHVHCDARNLPNGYGVSNSTALNNGVWHNMVSVLDRNTGQLELYVDGVFISSTSFPNQTNFDANGFLRFGVHMWSNTFQSSAYWIGEIDDISVYNRALSSSDIQQLYTLGQTTYLWSNGASTANINVSPTSTTTYTCTTTTNGVSCTDSVTVVVNNPTIDLGSDVSVCGTSTTLTAPAGFDSYVWSNGATTNTTTVTANGTYTCTVTQGGCSVSDSIDVTLIDATISASDSIICVGENTTLAVSLNNAIPNSNGNSILYSITQGLNSPWIVNWPVSQGGSYQLKVSGTYGIANGSIGFDAAYIISQQLAYNQSCAGYQDTWLLQDGCPMRPTPDVYNPNHVYFYQILNADGSVDFSYSDCCFGDNSGTLSFELTELNSSSYLWSNGATTPTINVTPTQTTTYTCTVTDANGNACTDSVTVVVNNPTIDLGNDVTACGTSTTLTAPTGFDSYVWSNGATTNSTTVNANGTYSCTVKQGLCSATDSIDVVLVPLTTNTSTASACDSFLWNGTTYTASGVYTGTTTNCVTESLNLTITPSSTNTTPISACDSYTWNGTTYTASGVYTGPTTNCVTESLNLIITPSSTNSTPITACNSYTWNGTTYTASGVYTGTTTNCVTESLNLTITPSSTNSTPISACDSYLWNGTTYTTSGVYSGTTTNCVTESLNLTITPSSTNTTTITACDSYVWNGTTYSATGVYTGTTTNCVTESLSLTITASSTNTTTASACNSYTWNGTSYTTSGVYTGTTTNCVTESLNLTITPSSTNTTTITACDSYVWNGTTYTTSGVYTGTTTNCVTESLNLTITPLTTTGSVTTSICAGDSYVWPANGQAYTTTQSGLTVITGCNTATLNLTITPSSTNTTTITACNSYVWNGTTYTTSGVYSGTTTNCVTESLNLTITPSSTNTTIITACGTYTWANNGQTYTTSGVYTGTTTDCVTESLVLTITTGGTSNITTITACGTYTWANNGQTYTTSGVYTGTTTNCVTEFLNLTITPSSTNTLSITACGSYVWNGTTYASSGVYTGTTTNCITQSLNLTIIPPDTNTVNVNATPTYFWVFTGQIYTVSGTYQFLDVNKCVLEILNLSLTNDIAEESSNAFTIFPNPVSDMLYVNLNGQDKQNYLIIDNFGSVVKKGVLGNLINEISVSELSAGLYYFKIEGTKPRKFSKID
jgi:hypothetical protein